MTLPTVYNFPTDQQFSVLLPFVAESPEWLVIVGVGDGNEAQMAVKAWPKVKIIGIDPDPRVIAYQRESGWRQQDTLLNVALYNSTGSMPMLESQRGAMTAHPGIWSGDRKELTEVPCQELDSLGPLPNAVLWIDAEGCDFDVLHGGQEQLKHTLAVVVEKWLVRPNMAWADAAIDNLLHAAGFRCVAWFGVDWWGRNEVWVR